MSDFLDAFLDAWHQVPHDWQVGIIIAAVVVVVWAIGAIVKHCLTFQFRDSLALQFLPGFKARDVQDGTDDKGRRRTHRPSQAEALEQLKRCLHVWRVRGGYLTFITYQANQGLLDSAIQDRARDATKDGDYTHTVKRFGRLVLLHSWIGGK